jgi:hypothetical protein
MDAEERERRLREFHLNGFVILPGFLPLDWVRSARDQLLPILRGEFERASKGKSRIQRGDENRLAINLEQYADLLGGALDDDLFRRNPVIEDLVGEIFGGADRFRRGWTQVEAAFPGTVHMNWHSDQTFDETPDMEEQRGSVRLTYNIPLVDFTWASGAMEILPGSHRLPRSFLNNTFKEIQNVYPVPLSLRLGDALLRDGNGLHRGTPNLTDQPRPMLDQTYKLKADD